MFNLLMAGDDSEWQVPIAQVHLGDFPLDRFLEYTDPSLEERFKPVTAETISYLAQLPTLFMSELQRSYGTGQPDRVRIQVGRIWNLSGTQGEIRFSFQIDVRFPDFVVQDRTAIEHALGLGKWEITRTHWAIKDKEIIQSLSAIGLELAPGPDAPAMPNSVKVQEIIPPYVGTDLLGYPDDPYAMPLKAFIDATITSLAEDGEEVIVEEAKGLRNNAGPSEYAFFSEHNSNMAALFASRQGG